MYQWYWLTLVMMTILFMHQQSSINPFDWNCYYILYNQYFVQCFLCFVKKPEKMTLAIILRGWQYKTLEAVQRPLADDFMLQTVEKDHFSWSILMLFGLGSSCCSSCSWTEMTHLFHTSLSVLAVMQSYLNGWLWAASHVLLMVGLVAFSTLWWALILFMDRNKKKFSNKMINNYVLF